MVSCVLAESEGGVLIFEWNQEYTNDPQWFSVLCLEKRTIQHTLVHQLSRKDEVFHGLLCFYNSIPILDIFHGLQRVERENRYFMGVWEYIFGLFRAKTLIRKNVKGKSEIFQVSMVKCLSR